MTVQYLPNIGDRLFFARKEVIVIKIYEYFQLVKVHYFENIIEFVVDISALSRFPDSSNAISIRLLRRS